MCVCACVGSTACRVPSWPETDRWVGWGRGGGEGRRREMQRREMDDGIRRCLQVKRCTCSHCLPITQHTHTHRDAGTQTHLQTHTRTTSLCLSRQKSFQFLLRRSRFETNAGPLSTFAASPQNEPHVSNTSSLCCGLQVRPESVNRYVILRREASEISTWT